MLGSHRASLTPVSSFLLVFTECSDAINQRLGTNRRELRKNHSWLIQGTCSIKIGTLGRSVKTSPWNSVLELLRDESGGRKESSEKALWDYVDRVISPGHSKPGTGLENKENLPTTQKAGSRFIKQTVWKISSSAIKH